MAKAHTLVDNFNDDAIDQYHATSNPTGRWIATFTHQLREVNGRVEIRMDSSPSTAYYTSASTYDLTSSEIRIELIRAPRTAPSLSAFLLLESTGATGLAGTHQLVISVENGVLNAYYLSGNVGSVPYVPALHRWLRIRETGGVVYWETSSEGTLWTVLGTNALGFNVTQHYIKFGVWSGAQIASPGLVVFDNFNVQNTSLARRVEERRLSARDVRIRAAEVAATRRHDEHVNNNDEVNYGTYTGRELAGMYSKSLRHDDFGDPEPVSYASLLRALESRDPQDFEEIILGPVGAPVKLTNPQAGLAFDIEGPDAQEITMPPAPRFDSEVAAHEMGELYWMAVARDVHFASYGTDAAVSAAITSINKEFPQFGGTAPVSAQNVFRGIYPGEQVGPYVSQYLLKGNVDPRKPDGLGRDANEGFISYGSRVIDQRLIPAAANVDYLTAFATWRDVQNGVDKRGQDSFDTVRRFIRNLRDGATFVHFDQVIDAYYNAAWILMSEPTSNQLTFQSGVTGRPQIDQEFPKDQGNPYDPPGTAMDSKTQVGFATFGPTHLLQVLGEVLGRALRAVWWQKWGVHRRLRPEEYGGRVHNHVTGARTYPLHPSIVGSLTLAPTAENPARLSQYFGNAGERFPTSYLLPQAYPEGAPTHPAYAAGHAAGSGALVTILKAFFDENKPIENPVQASTDGLTLVPYTGADASQMTVGGELNKLAGNIALFRNAAGVHWRSDYTESLPFGEAIAIGLLQEMSLGFNEDDAFFELTKFDGQWIRIFDGKVVPVA